MDDILDLCNTDAEFDNVKDIVYVPIDNKMSINYIYRFQPSISSLAVLDKANAIEFPLVNCKPKSIISKTMDYKVWANYLQYMDNRELALTMIFKIINGVEIMFNGNREISQIITHYDNQQIALVNSELIESNIEDSLQNGHLIGPYTKRQY